MDQVRTRNFQASRIKGRLRAWLSKPANIILLVFLLALAVLTLYPLLSMLTETVTIHTGREARAAKLDAGSVSLYHFTRLFATSENDYSWIQFYQPFLNTLLVSLAASVIAILFGGTVAFLVTRTNLKYKKFVSAVFTFPYIMPSWTLALFWETFFKNVNIGLKTSNGIMASVFGVFMPEWFVYGAFPIALVLGLHYAPFAYILIGGILRNMDANLEEAATILDTPRWKIFTKITIPMVRPAILSTILLVTGGAVGSYPVPHYLGLTTLSTKYVSMNDKYTGEASILAIVMMLFGVAIMYINQRSLHSRKQYTTVTGKSGQITKVNLGKWKVIIAVIFIIITFFTSIYPIISFAFETFLPNPGDYSFLYTGNTNNLTTKWWITSENITENGMYGQMGILYNKTIWHAFRGTIMVSIICCLTAGIIGTLIGYAVSKDRHSKLAGYVNSMAFLPYLMPSVAVGAAYFILFSSGRINLFNTYLALIIVGTVKYIPFSSRSSLNSMLQLSNEIEESAIILNVPWIQRMTKIIIPIQKSSIVSGFLLPFMTCLRELSLFMLLCTQGFILSTTLVYFDEMGLYAFSSGINLILIVTILICNALVNKITGASLDEGIGG